MDPNERRGYIGASDCAAVLGCNRWSSPIKVWAEKTGAVVAPDISGKLPVWLGNRLEDAVAELFTHRTGKKVRKVSEPFTHKAHPFLKCHIDRKVEGESAILQCKTTSAWKSKEWEGEEIPVEYVLQEVHELACTGYDKAYVAVLIGNEDFRIKEIDRDDQFINEVVEKEVRFWNEFVLKNIMPDFVTNQDAAILGKLYPEHRTGETVMLPSGMDLKLDSISMWKEDRKALENLIDKNENEVKAFLKSAEIGESAKWRVTWKKQTANRVDVERLKEVRLDIYDAFFKTSSTRVFRARDRK